jgi:hypothetical protein
MKSGEPAPSPPEGEGRLGQWMDTRSVPTEHKQASPPSGKSDSLANSLPRNDLERAFLHQLSQALTALRGTLELALLVDSNAQDYRRAIQQSLLQAEALVQLFKSYRALALGENDQA